MPDDLWSYSGRVRQQRLRAAFIPKLEFNPTAFVPSAKKVLKLGGLGFLIERIQENKV